MSRLSSHSGSLVLVNRGMTIGTPDVDHTWSEMGNWISSSLSMKKRLSRIVTASPFELKTLGQKIYVEGKVKNHDVTFGIGPAGTENLAVTLVP